MKNTFCMMLAVMIAFSAVSAYAADNIPADYSQYQLGFDGVITGFYDPNGSEWDPLNPTECTHTRALWAMEVDAEDDHNSYFEKTDVQSDKYKHTITGHPVRQLYCPECQQNLGDPIVSDEFETYTEQHRWGYQWDPVLDEDVPTGICEVCGYQCQHEDLISYDIPCTPTDNGDDVYHSLDFPGATTNVVCRICGMSFPNRTAPARNDYREEHNYENGVCTECGHAQPTCSHQNLKSFDIYETEGEDPVTGGWGLLPAQYENELYHKVSGNISTFYYCPDCDARWEEISQRNVERSMPHNWYMDSSTGEFMCNQCNSVNPCQHSRTRPVEYLTGTGVTADTYHRNDTHRTHSDWVFGDYCETCGLLFNVRTTFQTIEVPHTYDSEGFCKDCLHICTHTGDAVETTVENTAYSNCTAVAHTKGWDVRLPDICPYCAMTLGGQVQHFETVQPHSYTSSGVCSDCGFDLFAETANLPILSLPEDLKTIEEGAFDGSAAACVVVPDGCETIGDYAFANCPTLTIIRLPDSVTGISEYAFSGCEDCVIVAPIGSVAIVFAENNGIQYVAQ